MPTETLVLTERMARAMLDGAPKFRPVYLIRAFKMESNFELVSPGENSMPYVGRAGDYITIDDKGCLNVVEGTVVESDFKLIPPRTRKPSVVK